MAKGENEKMSQGTPAQVVEMTKGQLLGLRDKKMTEATATAKAALESARTKFAERNAKTAERQAKEIEKLEKSVTLASSGVRNAFDLILASL